MTPDEARLSRFPWPFTGDAYRYSANVEPAPKLRRTPVGAWGGAVLDVDADYEAELSERAAVLARDPARHVELPHMRAATWDALVWGLRELAATHPETMSLAGAGRHLVWSNHRLGLTQGFRLGEEDTLPMAPLRFLASQIQEDVVLLDQREGQLFADAGCVTFASNWSMAFDLGMSFREIHGPVPHDLADGAIPRAEQFLMRLQPGEVFRRINWTSTAGHRLDTALDSYHEWGPSRRALATGDLAAVFHMRNEVQHLVRLPESGAIMFLIRTYLLPLGEICRVPEWRRQFAAVLRTLPEDILQYKGLTALRPRILAVLEAEPVEAA